MALDATDPRQQAALALHRFGLGPKRNSIAQIASDPRGALLAEIERPGAGRINNPDLLSASAAARAAFEARAERRAQTILAERAQKENDRLAAESQVQAQGMTDDIARKAAAAKAADAALATQGVTDVERQNLLKEVKARLDAAFDADIGFAERLVWFWSNHFCVSTVVVYNMAAGYEREAIRPHVLGRFGDMLLAAEGHPAMLIYLDNNISVGANSIAGINRTRGLNENLAREILELHTLGVRTGYDQDDVTRFANVLTGWTIIPVAGDPVHGTEFIFNPRMHEPGPQRVLGKFYVEPGVEQGRAVLADLARHPATATHVATKLARYFSADDPPPSLVERLAKTFRDTDGDLKEMAKTLVASDEAWTPARDKLKRPYEWVVAMTRATGLRSNTERFIRGQMLMGEPLWRPSAPQGFADNEGAWIDGMGLRLDVATSVAERVADRVDPHELVEMALGPLASAETRQAVARAESRQQALALAFMSPEFQRR
ncbi:MAG TPA: DUF1800 family protein [Xanthobacteraceae bacterium]|jgi:uncharacterized protein (DUF1800 family)|nr:DUF1800 family protein [Xanthobacteraceae bacterium]